MRKAAWIVPVVALALLTLLARGTAFADRLEDAEQGGRPLTATMTGEEEVRVVNGVTLFNQGDLDGSGTASITLNYGQGEVCWELNVSDIAPATAAHIHAAPAGVPGDVVVPLTAPTDGSSADCASVDRELIKAILQNPEDYYVNVHNADFPGGAVRGQLSK